MQPRVISTLLDLPIRGITAMKKILRYISITGNKDKSKKLC
jgi:hypothetical protein